MARPLITLFTVAIAASGCASAPNRAEEHAALKPSVSSEFGVAAHQKQDAAQESLPVAGGSAQHAVRPVNFVDEATTDFRERLFSPDTTLDELIAYALGNNPEIQALHMQAHALQVRVPLVRALDDPMLMTTTFLEPIETAAGPQDVILGLSQKLPWFGKRALRGDVAFHEAQATFARMAASELAVVEQVKLAYFELYFLDRAVDVNKDLEARLNDVISIARTKYETAGEKTGLETVLQAQVELAQLQTVFVQLEQAKERAKARLKKTLHAPAGVAIELKPMIPETNVPKSADVLVALMDECQPKLDALRREMHRDQSAIALADRNYYPDVTVGFNWHAIGDAGLSRVATGEDAYSFVAGVNLPIYQGKLDAGVREAEFQAARTARMHDATWDEVRAEVETMHAQAIEHDRIVKILNDDILPKSKQTLDLSIEAYRVDRITFQQLIENYNTLLRHRLDYHRRLSQREQALANLELAVGCAVATWPVDLDEPPAPAMP